MIQSVQTKEFKELLSDTIVLLDVRTPAEFNEGHISQATLLDYHTPDFKSQLDALDKEKTYLVYCRSGSRSAHAMYLMQELGFKTVFNLEYGILDWKEKGFEIEN